MMGVHEKSVFNKESTKYCPECGRLKDGIYAIVASLVNKKPESALTLARVAMHGGSVNNPLDCERLGKKLYGKRKSS